ncbi:prophage endopeptidase tail family protein [Staphylococcus gallinarum]|uniref:prophage endopeptidase tail family protein n=1 Tax=Staphylococcus gallinarum TaxID=1293 RepID=UPI0030BCA170
MENLILKNKVGTFGEIVTDFDLGSFKYEYSKNDDRSISLTLVKTNKTEDIFNMATNENILNYNGQDYVIKSTSIKHDGGTVTNEIQAKHVFMDIQGHYIEKDEADESTGEDDKSTPKYSLKEYLDIIFKDNVLGFTYEIVGEFKDKKPVSEASGKNGLEMITSGAEIFDYIYYADNKKIYFYAEKSFYERSDEVLVYKYNTNEAQASVSTAELKTYIKGFGKKYTDKETKNYSAKKPADLSYSGKFVKEGTWYTEEVGASYTGTVECKFGNEEITWTLKKMSKGGMLDVFLDGEKVGTYDCYSKTAKSEKITLLKKASKGTHTIKVVHKGAKSGVDYKNTNPRMYVATEKSVVLSCTATLTGNDQYKTYTEYKSPNYELFGHIQAPSVYDENITEESEMLETLKSQLSDEPVVELSTHYLGNEDIKDNNTIRFVHAPLGFNLDLKVVKTTRSHPLTHQPVEVEFNNAKTDIVQIQQKMMRDIKNNNTKSTGNVQFTLPENYSDIVGVTTIDD